MTALTEMSPSTSGINRGVPAVRHTIAIFGYLRDRGNEPATMTEIAQALGMNPSTCFNILKTLEQGDLLAFDSESKHYELGTGLRDLGAAVSEEGAVLTSARMKALEFVRRYKLIMLICQKAEDDSFMVIDKMRGRPDPKGTAPLGGRVPPNGAVLAKAYYAHQPDETIDQMLELHGLPSRTPMSITQVARFKQELAEVRERGYSISIGEYEPDYNAVGAPILSPTGTPILLMVVTGHSSFMPERLIPAIGQRLSEAVQDISRAVFHLEGASRAHLDRLGGDEARTDSRNRTKPKPTS
ncbi:MAG: IclR family transcriptional regulator [Solirubrobacterales bacterium]|nr:IclR family transcriptional regulator [Solirubrobacterales bacterium]